MNSDIKIISGANFSIGISPIENVKFLPFILSESEKTEILTISFQPRQHSWWKVREILSELAVLQGIDYHGLKKGENGKPHFIQDSNYQCSLSHSSSLGVAIISSASCGIDIEKIDPKIERILSKFSSLDELKGKKEIKFMTALWACKESIYKALDIPGIHFREQIILKNWGNDMESAQFEFISDNGNAIKFYCHIRWIEDHVLAYTLQ